jgi:hypothetical protein
LSKLLMLMMLPPFIVQLMMPLRWFPEQGDQIGQFFANWATFGGSL